MTPREKALLVLGIDKKRLDSNVPITDEEIEACILGLEYTRNKRITQEAYEIFRALCLKYGVPVPEGKTWAALAADAFTAARAFREVAEGVENA